MDSIVPWQASSHAFAECKTLFDSTTSSEVFFTVTIGPGRPRMGSIDRKSALPSPTVLHQLARLASRHGPTTVMDGQGGAMVLGAPDGDVELF